MVVPHFSTAPKKRVDGRISPAAAILGARAGSRLKVHLDP
jgi:hypothetical protein